MRTYFTCAALGFALVVGAPVAHAQSRLRRHTRFSLFRQVEHCLDRYRWSPCRQGSSSRRKQSKPFKRCRRRGRLYVTTSWRVIARLSVTSLQLPLRGRSIITSGRHPRCRGLLCQLSSHRLLLPRQGKCSISRVNFCVQKGAQQDSPVWRL